MQMSNFIIFVSTEAASVRVNMSGCSAGFIFIPEDVPPILVFIPEDVPADLIFIPEDVPADLILCSNDTAC